MTDIPPSGQSPQPGSTIMLALLFVVVILAGLLLIWVMRSAMSGM